MIVTTFRYYRAKLDAQGLTGVFIPDFLNCLNTNRRWIETRDPADRDFYLKNVTTTEEAIRRVIAFVTAPLPQQKCCWQCGEELKSAHFRHLPGALSWVNCRNVPKGA